MLIPQKAQCRSSGRQGSRPVGLKELRSQLQRPSAMNDEHRQRLLECVRRLARVRALGDEYARVGLSPQAAAAEGSGLYVSGA